MTPPGEGLGTSQDPRFEFQVRVARSKMDRISTMKFGPNFFYIFRRSEFLLIKLGQIFAHFFYS